MIYKVAVVGDTHFNSTTPQSRLDDYPRTTLRKLSEIGTIALEKGVSHLILLGDVFHKNSQSLWYLNRVIEEFNKIKEKGIECWSIVGNHDIAWEKMETLDRSPLQTLFVSSSVKPLKVLKLGESVEIYGYNYTDEISKVDSDGKVKVCVAHRFYDNTLSDYSLSPKQVISLNYDRYILGHDHQEFPDVVASNGSVVQRPGSLLRGTSHKYNVNREPSFDIITFEVNGNTVDTTSERVVLSHLPATEVFSIQALEKQGKEDLVEQHITASMIDELISKMETRTTSSSLFHIIDNIEMSPSVRGLIEKYLTANGLFRITSKEVKELV